MAHTNDRPRRPSTHSSGASSATLAQRSERHSSTSVTGSGSTGRSPTPARSRRPNWRHDRHNRTQRPRVARRTGRRRIRHLRRRRALLAVPGAGGGVHQRGQSGLCVWRLPGRHGSGEVRREDHRGVPHAGRDSGGTSTTTTCSPAPSDSSGRGTPPRSSMPGSRRSTVSSPVSKRGGRVADVGCGHGASTVLMAQHFPRRRRSSASTPRSVDRRGAGRRGSGRSGRQHVVRGGRRQRRSRRWIRPRVLLRLACTTWAIRSGRCATPEQRSDPTAR